MSKPLSKTPNDSEQDNSATDQANIRLGLQIRDLRKSKRVTIKELADKIGKSVGYLSQVERGVSSLPIPVLQAISDILEVQITWFFHADQPQKIDELENIVRGDSRRHLEFSGTGISEELLSPKLSGDILMIQSTLAPETSSGPEPRERKGGDEAGVVLSGTLELTIGEKTFTLEKDDSFSINGNEPHFIANPSKTEETIIIWVLTPQKY